MAILTARGGKIQASFIEILPVRNGVVSVRYLTDDHTVQYRDFSVNSAQIYVDVHVGQVLSLISKDNITVFGSVHNASAGSVLGVRGKIHEAKSSVKSGEVSVLSLKEERKCLEKCSSLKEFDSFTFRIDGDSIIALNIHCVSCVKVHGDVVKLKSEGRVTVKGTVDIGRAGTYIELHSGKMENKSDEVLPFSVNMNTVEFITELLSQ